MKATRDWFGDALIDHAETRRDMVVVNCDLGEATRTEGFKNRYPERFFECGIAEANAIGVASGLAQEGYRPFVASFGHFLTGKFLEIFQSVGLNDSGVVMVGTHAGLAIGKDGPTQMGLRDLALMRTIHNLEILQPADGVETARMMEYVVSRRRPTYLRLCRQPQAEVHGPEYRFEFGKPDLLRRGADIAVFTMGGPVEPVLDSLDELGRDGIHPTVVNVSSMPIDASAVEQAVAGHSHVLVVEDHFTIGGLSDAIGRALLERTSRVHFDTLAVDDYGQAGSPGDLYSRYRLDAKGIALRVRDFLDEQ